MILHGGFRVGDRVRHKPSGAEMIVTSEFLIGPDLAQLGCIWPEGRGRFAAAELEHVTEKTPEDDAA